MIEHGSIYDSVDAVEAGYRVLVMRLWPRGVRRELSFNTGSVDIGTETSGEHRTYRFDIAEVNGTLYVGIERVHQIVRFDYGKDGFKARGQPIPLPAGMRSMPSNRGLECLVVPPKGQPLAGTLIAI